MTLAPEPQRQGDHHDNIPQPLTDYNAYLTHEALVEGVSREGAARWHDHLSRVGAEVGAADTQRLADLAHSHPPRLVGIDRGGQRVDNVEFHPAWHEWLAIAVGSGAHSLSWTDTGPGSEVARAATYFLLNEAENGQACTMGMTHASVAAIGTSPALAADWVPKITSTSFDCRSAPIAEKTNAMIGMGMTEIHAGSDLSRLTTTAVPTADGTYLLSGRKWFWSAPTSDAFLVLASTTAGASCFLVPRRLSDGALNAICLDRLKDKVGDRSNASAEARLDRAVGFLVGEDGRGVATILQMVHYTRLNTALSSAGITHHAVSQALHYTHQRTAFGSTLDRQPSMANVLADLALESEAQVALMLRVARSFDDAAHDDSAAAFGRLAVAVQKYWTCKRTPWAVYESMECLGGNGYIEDWPLGRLYRQAPLNSIWEGSGNVIALDVARVVRREPHALGAVVDEIDTCGHPRVSSIVRRINQLAADVERLDRGARRLAELLAVGLQASLLVRHAPSAVSDAFVHTRLGDHWSGSFGTLPAQADTNAIVERARPQ